MGGKHVLVRSPLASCSIHANELVEISRKQGVILCVDHPLLFSGPVQKIKSIIQQDELGKLLYYDALRYGFATTNGVSGLIWGVAHQDLALLDYFVGRKARAVMAVDSGGSSEIILHLIVDYENVRAHLHLNGSPPVKLQRVFVGVKFPPFFGQWLSKDWPT
ncbi:MAG: hypothetical protein NTV38_04625 [Chloroflexi bacterium]|nr:hypothetical protein [Chloroflexota bacterium]